MELAQSFSVDDQVIQSFYKGHSCVRVKLQQNEETGAIYSEELAAIFNSIKSASQSKSENVNPALDGLPELRLNSSVNTSLTVSHSSSALTDVKERSDLSSSFRVRLRDELAKSRANPEGIACKLNKFGFTFDRQTKYVESINQFSPLMYVCANSTKVNALQLTRVLIGAGEAVNEIDEEGRSAVFYVKDARFLLILRTNGASGNRADLNLRDKSGNTALFYVEDSKLANEFLKGGASVNAAGQGSSVSPLSKNILLISLTQIKGVHFF